MNAHDRRFVWLGWTALLAASGCRSPVETAQAQAPAAPERVLVPAGPFTMGADDGLFDERPAHAVRLAAYRIDRTEVTNAAFRRFVDAAGYAPKGPWQRGAAAGHDAEPVRWVTWHDAVASCRWAGGRLPTEAEWEKAARGAEARRWPWGDRWRAGAVRLGASWDDGPEPAGAHPAGASPYGALDLAGNVWEWTADWYDRWLYAERTRSGQPIVDPKGPPDGAKPYARFVAHGTAAGNERSTLKVVRGGGFTSRTPWEVRTSRRLFMRPDAWSGDVGFRCAYAP